MSLRLRSLLSLPMWFVILLFVLIPVSVAQDTAAPDRVDLASRLLGFEGELSIPLPSPIYAPGDTAEFWVSKVEHDTPVQVTAELAGRGVDVYIWVEDGIRYNPSTMQQMANLLGQLWAIFRIRDNYPQVSTVPESPNQFNMLPIYQLPDIDNDPHLYVLYTRDLIGGQNTVYNPLNSLSPELVPGGYTNQHETVFVNTSNFPNIELTDSAYVGILARQFYSLLGGYNNPDQAAWLADAVSWYMLLSSQGNSIDAGSIRAFFDVPGTPLTQLSAQGFGAQQLFLNYLDQRFGSNVLTRLATGSGLGVSALDNALRESRISDPVTGNLMTARDVFADFVMANALNSFFGDGRYIHSLPVTDGLLARVESIRDQFDFDAPDQFINQFGTRYIVLQTSEPTAFTIFFDGQTTVARLPMAGQATNRFYWSGDVANRDATLTRTFDLSGITTADLTFDAWYTLADGRNYAYVEVSTDGGITWETLPATSTAATNPYGLNYGEGFTGISNTEKIRPFPYVGVVLDTDGVRVNSIAADGPLASTDLQPNDQIIGHDGEAWADQPDIIGLLAGYEPGDTVNLFIQRGEDTFDLPVVLGDHPTRVRVPDALWIPQAVDLSAYAGEVIQLRFEAISLPGSVDSGIAIDNIAIPELGFLDNAENTVPGWTLNGWQQTTNQIRQQFLVQTARLQQNAVHITQHINPSDTTTQGTWDFTLGANEALLLAISGLNDNTIMPAQYTLRVRSQALP